MRPTYPYALHEHTCLRSSSFDTPWLRASSLTLPGLRDPILASLIGTQPKPLTELPKLTKLRFCRFCRFCQVEQADHRHGFRKVGTPRGSAWLDRRRQLQSPKIAVRRTAGRKPHQGTLMKTCGAQSYARMILRRVVVGW